MINNVSRMSKSDSIINSFIINREEINDPQIIANNFNDFFINVGGHHLINADSQYKKYLNEDVCSNFKFESVTNEQIIKIIEGLKSIKAFLDMTKGFQYYKNKVNVRFPLCLTI